jgi:hypothetical protein
LVAPEEEEKITTNCAIVEAVGLLKELSLNCLKIGNKDLLTIIQQA